MTDLGHADCRISHNADPVGFGLWRQFQPHSTSPNAAPASTAAPRTTQALSSASEALENQRERITFTLDEGGGSIPAYFFSSTI